MKRQEGLDIINGVDMLSSGVPQIITSFDTQTQNELLKVYNNTEQYYNIIYEDAANEDNPTRNSFEQLKHISSGGSPLHAYKEKTGSFLIVTDRANKKVLTTVTDGDNVRVASSDLTTDHQLPTYDEERDLIQMNTVFPEPRGHSHIGSKYFRREADDSESSPVPVSKRKEHREELIL